MDQYIKQLLLLHSKIIFPGFGAIVIANEDTGELLFNEYLTYDDGKLASKLEEESTMDLQEAKNSVAKFVRELQLQLNKGETYAIFQLGEFRKDDSGAFIFEGNINSDGKSASDPISGPSPTPATLPTSEKEKEVVKPIQKEEISPTPKEENVKEPEEKIVIIPTPQSKEIKPDKPAAKKNTYVEKSVDGAPIVEPIKKENLPPTPPVEVKIEKKRRKGFLFWFLLIFLFLILGASTYVGLNYDKLETFMGWNTESPMEKELRQAQEKKDKEVALAAKLEAEQKRNDALNKELDSTKINEKQLVEEKNEKAENDIVKVELDKTPKVEESFPISNSSGKHHIVIGCFEEKSNADRMVSDFRSKGFDSEILSQIGGLYFVTAQSYSTLEEAKSDLSRVRQIKKEAWLFKR